MRRLIGGMLFFLTAIVLFWSVAFLIITLLNRETFSWHAYTENLMTVILAHFMFSLLILVRKPWRKSMELFQTVIDAMLRIAKGDFNIRLDTGKKDPRMKVLLDHFNRMAVELGHMEKMRQEFIANVSHEIQSPLTSIGGFAQALQSESLRSEERAHYLDIIQTECRRLSKLSDNLLKLASLDSDQHPFEPKSYRLDKQLREIVLSHEPQWLGKELEMEVDLDEVTLYADRELINQVWSNLLHNSIKFTPAGGTISLILKKEEDEVRVTLTDTGAGIPLEDQGRIFERFYKADRSRNRVGGGSGLGLSIVKTIVDMHGGTITVSSKEGEGTTFVVTLPVELSRHTDRTDRRNQNRS